MTTDEGQQIEGVELEEIISQTVSAVEQARDQIFSIAESARVEFERMESEVVEAKQEASELIRQVDDLERKEQAARRRLTDVSRDFANRSEDEIKEAYERAREYGVEVQVARERERHLRRRRDDLERRLRHLEQTVKKAEDLVSQVGIAMDLLSGKMREVSRQFDDIKQKRELGLSIVRAQEEERRRLARDIHDGPAQLLANVVLRIDICQRLLDADPQQIREELEQLKDLVRLSLKDVRKIIFDLRPMALDDLGLVPAIRTYLKAIEERSDVAVQPLIMGEEGRLQRSLEVAVFRLIQEATNNAIRHAQADTLRVKLEIASDVVRAVVEDDGKGFDFETATGDGKYGLLNMRERVELLDGTFSVDSEAGKGTRVNVVIPLSAPQEGRDHGR